MMNATEERICEYHIFAVATETLIVVSLGELREVYAIITD